MNFKCNVLLFVLAAISFCGHQVSATTISVNFHAQDVSSLADHQLSGGEVAGLTPIGGWNNINVGTPGANNTAGAIFPVTALNDNTNSPTGATIAPSATSTWFVGYAASTAATAAEIGLPLTNQDDLYNSYLALNGPNGDGSPADAAVVSITGLGAPYTTLGYDLIIYSDSDRTGSNNNDRASVFTVTPAGGTAITVLTEDDGRDAMTFDGTFVLSDNVSDSNSYSNYTVISGLTAASFDLEITSPDGGRGGINGFQIIRQSQGGGGGLACDYDSDLDCDPDDLDLLYAEFGQAFDATFDADGSGAVDAGDIDAWLGQASSPENPFNANGVTYVLGDVDFDGSVTSGDLGIMLNNFGDTSGLLYEAGNLSDDANVSSGDLGLLLNNFGFTSAAASAVPEPAGLAWLAALFAALVARRRRK